MTEQLGLFDEAPSGGPFSSIEEARGAASACVRCPLSQTRRRVVFGVGLPTARLMIVGEGPSEADDASGQPFSGPSGRVLDAWLAALNLRRDQVWLTNIVRCRPAILEGGRPRNRPPRAGEIAACQLWMDAELALVRPAALLLVGSTPAKALLGKDFKLTADRGRWLTARDGTPALATYNPAYVLRLEGDDRTRAEHEVALDLATVRDRLA